jgi:hypothetical protein
MHRISSDTLNDLLLQVKPAKIVDKAIAFWLDIVTPGRGAGESNW